MNWLIRSESKKQNSEKLNCISKKKKMRKNTNDRNRRNRCTEIRKLRETREKTDTELEK